MELESTKARNETFGKESEDRLTTKDIGLDKEEEKTDIEEALILISLGMHSKSTQPSECMEARGLFANFLPQRPSLRTQQVPHWPSQGKPSLHESWCLSGRLS